MIHKRKNSEARKNTYTIETAWGVGGGEEGLESTILKYYAVVKYEMQQLPGHCPDRPSPAGTYVST